MERTRQLSILALALVAVVPATALAVAAEPLACPEGTTLARDKPPRMNLACKNAAGKRHGPFLGRFENGALRTRGQYRDGKQTGWWRHWNAEGVQESEFEYRDGKRIARRRIGTEAGSERRSRPSDPVHPCPDDAVVAGTAPPEGNRQSCERGRADGAYVLHGPSIVWASKTGELSGRKEYRNGVLHGMSISWSNGRKQRETPFVDGESHGLASYWYDDGTKNSETEYQQGRVRRRTAWDALGQLESETLNDEKGKAVRKTTWHPNGQMKYEEVAKAGEKHWARREWHANGQLEEEGEKQGGRRVGRWRWWNEDGELTAVETADSRGARSRKTFAVYEDDAPDWVPRPLPQPRARASSEPLHCPAGSRKVEQKMRLTAEDLGIDEEIFGALSELERLLLRAAALLPVPLGHRDVCMVGHERHGPAIAWFSSGRRAREGEFRNDRRHGTWIAWDEHGQKASEGAYYDGVPHGRSVSWHPNGNIQSIRHYERGVLDGVSASWYPNGARSMVWSHRLGTEHGISIWYNETGLKVKQGEYRDATQHGLWIEWGADGYKRSEKSYRDGNVEGHFAKWYAGGVPENQGEIRNGESHGLWIKFYKGRKSSEAHYTSGKYEGGFTKYHRNGRIREQGSHERDRRVGTWSEYYSDGVLRARGNYSWCENPPTAGRLKGHRSPTAGRGCKMGPWTYWTQSGKVLRTRDYDEINRPDPRSGRGAASIGVVGM